MLFVSTTMAFPFLPELVVSMLVLLAVVVLGSYYIKSSNKNPLLPAADWPVAGILPSLVHNLHRLHDYIALDLLAPSGHSRNFAIASLSFFITCDPANIRHIFTSNRANYPKGEELGEIFDVTKGAIVTIDGESSRRQRVNYQGVLNSPRLVGRMTKLCRDKVEKGLLPLMAHMARTGTPVDMADLMTRLVFDLYVTTVFGVDPARLSPDMPPMHVSDAMDTVMEVGLVRIIVPAFCWKAMRRLNIGPERKLAAAQAVLRCFINDMIREWRKNGHTNGQEPTVDILSSYIDDPEYNGDLLHPTITTYMIAGRDTIGTTLPWIFYNLSKNPHVVSSIRDELAPIVSRKAATAASAATAVIFEPEEVKALVYLQATVLETLRLYPPIALERKTVAATDVMPTGHEVCSSDIVIVSLYALGRMEAVWGADCREYRPERWLSEDGRKLRFVPSHEFLTFHAGPRLCLGKDIALLQLKIIVAAIVWNFDVKALDGQAIDIKLSCLLQLKHGLKVKLNKREMKHTY